MNVELIKFILVMMFEDNITKLGKIESQGKFEIPNGVFYMFVSPIGDAAANIITIQGRPCYNEKDEDCPLIVGAWSPIVFSSVTLTSEQLSKYSFTWGTEGV